MIDTNSQAGHWPSPADQRIGGGNGFLTDEPRPWI